MGCYDPGTKTFARKIGENRYALDSFRGAPVTYEVNLTPGQVCCSCPHYQSRLIGTDGQCKHIVSCIEQREQEPQPTKLERAATVAETLPDADLKQYAAERVGTAAGAACLLELAKRQARVSDWAEWPWLDNEPDNLRDAEKEATRQPRPIPAGVMELLAGATEAEKARCLEIYAQ